MHIAHETLHLWATRVLRVSLALVFVWFGVLKIAGVSPVVGIIAKSYPFIAEIPTFYFLLALLEIVLGIGILIPRLVSLSAWIMVGHLLVATLGVLLSPQAFAGGFPLLSVVGEFVVKNFVLIAGALVVISENEKQPVP